VESHVRYPVEDDEHSSLTRGELLKLVVVRFGLGLFALAVLFFLPAGTFSYWQAWVWLAVVIIPMLLVLGYLLKNDPALLERRMRTREKEPQQSLLQKLAWLWLVVFWCWLDHRLAGPHVPTALSWRPMFWWAMGFFWCWGNSYASLRGVDEQQSPPARMPSCAIPCTRRS
jgi:hypothetical protein